MHQCLHGGIMMIMLPVAPCTGCTGDWPSDFNLWWLVVALVSAHKPFCVSFAWITKHPDGIFFPTSTSPVAAPYSEWKVLSLFVACGPRRDLAVEVRCGVVARLPLCTHPSARRGLGQISWADKGRWEYLQKSDSLPFRKRRGATSGIHAVFIQGGFASKTTFFCSSIPTLTADSCPL